MPKVAQRVECPNCWHCFNPVGRSTNPRGRRRMVVVERRDCQNEGCPNVFETARASTRFCSRRCQLAAYSRRRRLGEVA